MVAAFLLVSFGIRSYRDTVGGGTVRFGRAFAVGALIACVASACYVVTSEAIRGRVAPDFMEKYQAHALDEMRADSATEAEVAAKRTEMERYAKLYENRAVSTAITFVEPLPVGLLFALVSAAGRGRTGREHVIAQRDGADEVFLGVVVRVDTSWARNRGADREGALIARFRVERRWKGSRPDTISVLAATTRQTSSCDYRFTLGERYLVFGLGTDRSAALRTDHCAGTRTSAHVDSAIAALGAPRTIRVAKPAAGS